MTDDYKVEGYGVKTPEYDGPYLKGADFDPKVKFANAGDVKAAEEAEVNKVKLMETEPTEDPTDPALEPVKTVSETLGEGEDHAPPADNPVTEEGLKDTNTPESSPSPDDLQAQLNSVKTQD